MKTLTLSAALLALLSTAAFAADPFTLTSSNFKDNTMMDAKHAGAIKTNPLRDYVAATSVGIVNGAPMLDLCYEEDSQADVDMNVVMTEDGGLVETQATAEKGSYSRSQLNGMIDMAEAGIRDIFAAQRAVLGR